MEQRFFLGANAREGFSSLYAYFPGTKDCFLHIIKGGPGTGKSTFMKKIGEAAQERGLEVQTVLCSGDPQSLDGVCVPALRQAWVDGTAPHVCEPRSFGVDADYVNLGVFCRTPLPPSDRAEIERLSAAYRAQYHEAYRQLARAEIRELPAPPFSEAAELIELPVPETALPCPPERCFLRAVTREGEILLGEEVTKLCPVVRRLSPSALASLSRELERLRLPAVRCPLPLDSSRLDAILLPWAGCAFLASVELCGLDGAVESLRRAGELHDRIEQVYRAHMDFAALSSFTEQTVTQLFP